MLRFSRIHRRPKAALAALAAVGLCLSAVVVVGVVREADPQALGAAPTTAEGIASRAAQRTGRPVRVDTLTDETTEVWAQPQGNFRAELSVGAARVRRGAGWVPVDLTLQPKDGQVTPVAHPRGLQLSGAQPDGTHDLATVGLGGDRVALQWTGKLPEPVLDGPTARYPDAIDGVDLIVRATGEGFAQSLIVRDRSAISRVRSVKLSLTGPGAARHQRDKSGVLTLLRADGGRTVTIPPLAMWDSRTDVTGTPVRKAPIRNAVARTSRGLHLTLTPDQAWLRDPATVYPVTLDPTLSTIGDTYDLYVKEGVTLPDDTTNDLQVGPLSNGRKTRSFLTWNSSVLQGKQVTKGSVQFFNFWSNVCTAKFWEIWPTASANAATVWSNQPALIGTAPLGRSSATHGGPTCADQSVSIDAKAFFQHFATPGQTRSYMAVKVSDETDLETFKQFRSKEGVEGERPTASVEYNNVPSVTARGTVPATTCVTGANRPLVKSLTPELKATVTDADGPISVDFEWYPVGSTVKIGGQRVTGVANGGTATAKVPAGAFSDGGRYAWRVLANDGVSGSAPWSSYCEMTTWVTVPPVEGCDNGIDSDYNGDGTSDIAVGDPEAAVNDLAKAGTVTVSYGGSDTVQELSQAQAEVPGDAEAGDQFGFALATYDANRDGCSDLAVSAPFESAGDKAEAGGVALLLGSPAGLGKGVTGFWYDQIVTGWGDAAESGDWFGYALAAGNTAGGDAYLAVGAPGEDLGTVVDAGMVHYRRSGGDGVVYGSGGAAGTAATDERFGYSLTGSPYHLAVGAPGRTVGGKPFAGEVRVYSQDATGSPLRLLAALDQAAAETAEANDTFGKSIAMARYRAPADPAGSATSLLVVGVPGEDVGTVVDAGLVHRYRLTSTGAAHAGGITQETRGNGSVAEDGDYFGERVRVANIAPDAVSTPQTLLVAVGAPGEDLAGTPDAGQVSVFGAAADPVLPLDVDLDRRAGALPGSPVEQELIGSHLGGSATRLFVAAPYSGGTVYGLSWAELAEGRMTPATTLTAGADGIATGAAFGAAIG